MRVLIVDDSSVMRKIVARGLRQAGFTLSAIMEAGDGQQAMDLLKTDTDFKLILSDWNMPVMDGLNFVKAVRSSTPQVKNIPIVMVTTEGGESKVAAAMEAGANGHIKKPFTPDILKESLNSFLK